MIPARSDLLDFDEVDQTSHGRSNPTLVSLHFIRSVIATSLAGMCAIRRCGVARCRGLSGCLTSSAHREDGTGAVT